MKKLFLILFLVISHARTYCTDNKPCLDIIGEDYKYEQINMVINKKNKIKDFLLIGNKAMIALRKLDAKNEGQYNVYTINSKKPLLPHYLQEKKDSSVGVVELYLKNNTTPVKKTEKGFAKKEFSNLKVYFMDLQSKQKVPTKLESNNNFKNEPKKINNENTVIVQISKNNIIDLDNGFKSLKREELPVEEPSLKPEPNNNIKIDFKSINDENNDEEESLSLKAIKNRHIIDLSKFK